MRTRLSALITFVFLLHSLGPAPVLAGDSTLLLPKPGTMVHLSAAFNPPVLKGIKVYPDHPFRLDFVLDRGDEMSAEAKRESNLAKEDYLKKESTKLIKYFLTSLTIPENDLWVNLSPYEKDRIVPESFGRTEMGRDLLAQDYMLKQITASLIYPEEDIGKKFWKRIYEEAAKKFGATNIPVNTFNKVWIVPEKAVVYENVPTSRQSRESGSRPNEASVGTGTAYVVESRLKVMLEEDYLGLNKNIIPSPNKTVGRVREGGNSETNALGSKIVREIVLPQLTKEINEGQTFAQLRQVYNSVILANWYKRKLKDSILSQVYANKSKIGGITSDNPQEKMKIYEQYLKAFKIGAFNYIKEEIDPGTKQPMPHKYFSGGLTFNASSAMAVTSDYAMIPPHIDRASIAVTDIRPSVDPAINDWILNGRVDDIKPSVRSYRGLDGRQHVDVIGLEKKVVVPLEDGRRIFIADHHNHAYSFWWLMMTEGRIKSRANKIFHIDAHADAQLPPRFLNRKDDFTGRFFGESSLADIELDSKNLGIEGFIAPLVEAGFISDWHWLYNLDTGGAVSMEKGGQFHYKLNDTVKYDPEGLSMDILDIDIDVFGGYGADVVEQQLNKFAELAKRAKVITIVTSPEFIDQGLAIELARKLVRKIEGNPAMAIKANVVPEDALVNEETDLGGIDLNSDIVENTLEIKNDRQQMGARGEYGSQFVDPAMLKQIRDATGLVPVIINMSSLKSLPEFLGIN